MGFSQVGDMRENVIARCLVAVGSKRSGDETLFGTAVRICSWKYVPEQENSRDGHSLPASNVFRNLGLSIYSRDWNLVTDQKIDISLIMVLVQWLCRSSYIGFTNSTTNNTTPSSSSHILSPSQHRRRWNIDCRE